MNGRCLDCGELVPDLSHEELEAAGWSYYGQISAMGFVRHNWRCSACVEKTFADLLRKAQEATAEIRARELAGEFVGQDVMEFRMR